MSNATQNQNAGQTTEYIDRYKVTSSPSKIGSVSTQEQDNLLNDNKGDEESDIPTTQAKDMINENSESNFINKS